MTPLAINPIGAQMHSLTGGLRFVERNGCMILQQEWLVQHIEAGYMRVSHNEWRDVPVVM